MAEEPDEVGGDLDLSQIVENNPADLNDEDDRPSAPLPYSCSYSTVTDFAKLRG